MLFEKHDPINMIRSSCFIENDAGGNLSSVRKLIISEGLINKNVKMSIFSKFFSQNPKSPDPEIQFGRYTDTNKPPEKYKSWDYAVENFDSEKYLVAYTHLLDFMSNSEKTNLSYTLQNGILLFNIQQGSKIIEGEANTKIFSARAKIVRAENPPLGLMRLLLENNFDLKYARYAFDESDCICLKFDTFVEDGSPHKIYDALKELATEADKKDDVIISKFEGLYPINRHHTREVSAEEIHSKYQFFRQALTNVLNEINNGSINTFLYPGAISYQILNFIYKIDYLIKPEGNILEQINLIHKKFFNDTITSIHDKNKEMIRLIREFEKISFDEFASEIYEVSSTFGTSVPESHQRLIEIIDAQTTDLEWYCDNNFSVIGQAICGYTIGYSLYSFALPDPTKALLKLYYSITENQLFQALHFNNVYISSDQKFNKSKITSAIKEIIKANEEKYGKISVDLSVLNFENTCTFCKSYLSLLKSITYHE